MTDRSGVELEMGMAALEVEQAFLGCFILDRDAIAGVVDQVRPRALSTLTHRWIYQAVIDLFRRGEPTDLVTLSSELSRRGQLDQLPEGGVVYLSTLLQSPPTAAHVEYYGQEVMRFAYRRAIIDLGTRLVSEAYMAQVDFNPHPLIRTLLDEADDLSLGSGQGPKSYADLIPAFADLLERSWAGEDVFHLVATGFHEIDRALRGGFRGGDLVIVAGRPSSGKTAFGLQLATNHARRHRGQVLLFSAEMSGESLLWRAVAEASGIPLAALESGKTQEGNPIPEFLKDRLVAALEHMVGLPVLVDDTSRPTVDQMLSRAARVQRDGALDVMLFDYVEQAGDQVGRNEGEERRIAAVSRGLKHIAKTLDIPVVGISQVSRKVEERADKRPRMSDLKWSGAIEQDADTIMLIYRHGHYVSQGMADADPHLAPDAVEINIAKQRNGTTGVYTIRFHEELMAFSDYGDNRYGSAV